MTIDWGGYEVFDFEVKARWDELTPAQARAGFTRIMDQRLERVAMLGDLGELNGHEFGTSDAAVQRVNDFFRLNIERGEDMDGYPTPDWGSVSYDVGLYVGEVLIARFPNLHWKLDTAKKSASANQPVISGFRGAHPRYSLGVYGRFVSYGYHILNSGPESVLAGGRTFEVSAVPVNESLMLQMITAASEVA